LIFYKHIVARLLLTGTALTSLLLFASNSSAQPASTDPAKGSGHAYPAKPLRLIVGQTAGGISDMIARMVAQRFTEAFKQPAVVENRAGAAGSIGTEMAVKAAPDGYTLLLSSAGPIVINPSLYPKLSYDPQRDLAPIAFIAASPLVLVTHPSVPAKSVKALIALAKTHPYKLSYGSGGNGSPPHLTAALFSTAAGVTLTHVPFKGSAPSVLALVGGQVDLSFSTVAVTLPQMRAGRLNALAVTSAHRARILPDLPTMAEAGLPGFESQQWFGLFGPAALPRDIIGKLHNEVTRMIDNPEVRTRLANDGAEPGKITLDQFAALIRADAARWMKVIKVSGATAE
jgi:tripartite-type tricarboxylate transporter receptor subunit TctC